MAAGAEALDLALPNRWGSGWPGVIAPAAAPVAAGALAASLIWVVAGWRSWRDQGWPGTRPGLRGFALGLLLGLGMAGLALVLGMIAGGARVRLTGEPFALYLATAVGLGGSLGLAAFSEELLFRGFPLVRLADALGPVGASVALAVGFALFHLPNPGVTPLGAMNVALASLTLSAVFFRLGGVPAAWGAHLGWNAGLSLGADAPVSGLAFQVPGIEYTAGGVGWVTGGGFGPEGGLGATVVMSGAILWLGWGVRTDKTDGTERTAGGAG